MKQKYCPYCDQKMKISHYCQECRRIVWQPYEQNVDYYLNERHPQSEKTVCIMITRSSRRRWEDKAQCPKAIVGVYDCDRAVCCMQYFRQYFYGGTECILRHIG